MTAATFNAITYANKLKKAGMETKVADTQAEEMVNIMNSALATKEDVTSLNDVMKSEIKALDNKFTTEIKSLRNEMKVMELELKGFIIKTIIYGFTALAAVQGFVTYCFR